MRINPSSGPYGSGNIRIGAVDLTVELGEDAKPYAFSDMTGFTTLAVTRARGYWVFVHDGGEAGKLWRRLSWSPSTQPTGTSVTIAVRAANTLTELAGTPSQNNTFTPIGNNNDFSVLQITGRYLEVQVSLSRSPGVNSVPSLQNLTVHCN
jgi:hypothetical protein